MEQEELVKNAENYDLVLIRKIIEEECEKYLLEKKSTIIELDTQNMAASYALNLNDNQKKQIHFALKPIDNSLHLKLSVVVQQSLMNEFKGKISRLINDFNLEMSNRNLRICLISNIGQIEILFTFRLDTFGVFSQQVCRNNVRVEIKKVQTAMIHLLSKIERLPQKRAQQGKKTQKNSRKQLTKILEDLDIIKKAIEREIRSRDRSFLPALTYLNVQYQQIVSPNLQIQNKPPKHQMSLQEIEQKNPLDKKGIASQKNLDKIVKTISILKKQQCKGWLQPESGYGKIMKYDALYKIQSISINNVINQLIGEAIKKEKQLESQIFQSPLIEKSMKNKSKDQMAKASFITEIQILKYLRDYHCETVASYYLEPITHKNHIIKSFYINYYPKTMSNLSLRPDKIVYIFQKLSESLKFMNDVSLLHRDLKPDNVMIDQNFLPKLIDFGSATLINNQKSDKICQILKTTNYYNIRYSHLPDERIMTRSQFENHKNFDIYAYGKMMEKLIMKNQKTNQLGNLISKSLSWLIIKCTDYNPYNRINHYGLCLFMKKIEKFMVIKKRSEK